ncbi:hypothetical protein SCOCK_30152 [Actinacidiphila cocklensis]|uniref:Uncharacterized protein n=1 Tax=Actinacidiphila cocklensis TaxID=887465 RepID=A0A9W4DVY9_9ACTN|nr:hypothetical protein SCOCK_30152 [Actinacidiphila cocklensis]
MARPDPAAARHRVQNGRGRRLAAAGLDRPLRSRRGGRQPQLALVGRRRRRTQHRLGPFRHRRAPLRRPGALLWLIEAAGGCDVDLP